MNDNQQFNEIKAILDRHTEILTDQGKQLNEINTHLARHDERLNAIDKRCDGIENQMISIENRMTALEGRVAGQMKWIISLMVPTWVGMLGLLVAILLKG